jgi:hypothetical protein
MARVTLSYVDPRAAPDGSYFTTRVRFPFEKQGEPGRFVALFELYAQASASLSNDAAMTLVSEQAPHHLLSPGMVLELWQLPRLIGHAVVRR